ncbi:hypothetical protein ESCO_001716 [Escovopsis weberi]|uniref:Uncharacterized protein n=1 Tax=Escovopsis weberi TaxID=150374 RepID=A0A0M8MYV1_ESCWE|nr:hypothetical protein ESCO_001716 [Escovopsis weberi]
MSRRFETLGRPRGTQAAHRSREDAEVEDNRQLALGILEGRHVPAPDRSYTGSLTHIFQSMYQDEIKAHLDALSCRIRRLLDLPGRRRGWALLHSIIASELRPEDLCGVPRPRAGQKAVLLLVEEQARGGEEETRVRGRRNLEACSAGELDDVLEGVEARGWQDVILVTASDGSMPLRLGGRREVRVLEWGRDMI